RSWPGKNCPRELLAAKNGVTWNDFKKMIQQGGGVVSSGSSKKPSAPAAKPSKPASKPKPSNDWGKNKHDTLYKPEKGTFTVGGTRIMSREGRPFWSSTEAGRAYPTRHIRHAAMAIQDNPLWIGYTQNGTRWYLPIRRAPGNSPNNLVKMWGVAKLGWEPFNNFVDLTEYDKLRSHRQTFMRAFVVYILIKLNSKLRTIPHYIYVNVRIENAKHELNIVTS